MARNLTIESSTEKQPTAPTISRIADGGTLPGDGRAHPRRSRVLAAREARDRIHATDGKRTSKEDDGATRRGSAKRDVPDA